MARASQKSAQLLKRWPLQARPTPMRRRQGTRSAPGTFAPIVLSKEANGSDVSCELAHRWQAKEIDKLAEAKDGPSMDMGPARCTLKINAKRADILAAVTSPENTLKVRKIGRLRRSEPKDMRSPQTYRRISPLRTAL